LLPLLPSVQNQNVLKQWIRTEGNKGNEEKPSVGGSVHQSILNVGSRRDLL
jgi:hypothetical protein